MMTTMNGQNDILRTSTQQQQSTSASKESLEQLNAIKKELRGLPHIEVIEKIGQGSFGDIYKVWDSKRGRWAAMKFEKKDKKNKQSLIKKEAQIMQQVKGSRYFSILFDSRFSEVSTYSFIEMSFLGPNLESLKKRMHDTRFSLRTVLLIANQMISGLQVLHEKGILHRDIKPENFVIGSEGQHHQVYVIDFGLSKYYLDEQNVHIEQKQNKGLVGTARYTSINSHLGLEQSRRDDMESLAYLLLYFAKGGLVWQNLQVKDKEARFRKIAELKQTTPHETMCRGLPKQFLEFLNLVKSLGFTQQPEYDRYRTLFSDCLAENYIGPFTQLCFDWCPKACPLAMHRKTNNNNNSISGSANPLIDTQQHENNNNNNDGFNNDQNNNNNNISQQYPKVVAARGTDTNQPVIKNADTLGGLSTSKKQQQNNTNQNTGKKSHDLFDLLNFSLKPFPSGLESERKEQEDDSLEDVRVSEYENGKFFPRQIPVFRAETNHLKHQSQSVPAFSQMNLLTSASASQDVKFAKTMSMHMQTEMSISAMRQGQSVSLRQLQSQPMPSGHLHMIQQSMSTFQVPNKESSQFVNNWSNEWNSEQDEKAEAQKIVLKNSIANSQRFG